MKEEQEKKYQNQMYNALKKLRNEWPEGINPATKVMPDKKKELKKGKQKYKKNYIDEYRKDEGNER